MEFTGFSNHNASISVNILTQMNLYANSVYFNVSKLTFLLTGIAGYLFIELGEQGNILLSISRAT